ncbi:MAG: hypothetical protein AB7F78_26585 [Hyphomicrobiaceae bacterium]
MSTIEATANDGIRALDVNEMEKVGGAGWGYQAHGNHHDLVYTVRLPFIGTRTLVRIHLPW